MKILDNLTRGLILHQKHLLYRSCALPIALYGFQIWFYTKAPLFYLLKILGKLQRQAALWITRAFKIAPFLGIEAIASLILIQLHLQKLSERSKLRAHALSDSHILRSLMMNNLESTTHPYPLALSLLTECQCGLIKGYLVNMDNQFNEVFPSFDLLNSKFRLDNRIIDCFSNCFSFYLFSKKSDHFFKDQIQQLDNIAIKSSNSPLTALMVMDASVKNNIASFIVHIHVHNKPIVKTLYHAINITSTEAEFFAIRCSINQALHL